MKNEAISQREEPFGCAIILSLHWTKTTWSFVDYVKSFNLPNPRMGIVNLFKAHDTRICDRDKYNLSLMPFPYVNGMPPELRKAHRENDKAVMAAYGFKKDMTEAEIVGGLFKMYEDLTKQK